MDAFTMCTAANFTTTQDGDRSTLYHCSACGRKYKYLSTLQTHQRFECGKEPSFPCPHCPYKAKRKGNLNSHVYLRHKELGKL
ncbi:hypothetical protein J6590_014744 [Homalodisca vitripennis]|nr:hypothetical protein J6590_014744 [Homalodisca vitripennis]